MRRNCCRAASASFPGLFFGVAFGIAAVGAALLGWLADHTSIGFVFHLCSFLPAIGLLTMFLPDKKTAGKRPSRLTFSIYMTRYSA